VQYNRLLEGKRALITGGANGLGRACALKFAQHGASVVVADIDEKAGEELLKELRGLNPQCAFFRADLRNEEDIEALCKAYLYDFGAPDIWLNSAGMIKLGFADKLADEHLVEMTNLNAVMPMRIMRRLAPAMTAKKGGSIIQIASEYSITGQNNSSGYAASMGARHALTNAFAMDYAECGIRANTILPGAGVGAMADIEAEGKTKEEEHLLWGTVNPLWRRAEDYEVANAALFLASDMAAYITGEGLFVNGGQHVVSHNEHYRRERWAG